MVKGVEESRPHFPFSTSDGQGRLDGVSKKCETTSVESGTNEVDPILPPLHQGEPGGVRQASPGAAGRDDEETAIARANPFDEVPASDHIELPLDEQPDGHPLPYDVPSLANQADESLAAVDTTPPDPPLRMGGNERAPSGRNNGARSGGSDWTQTGGSDGAQWMESGGARSSGAQGAWAPGGGNDSAPQTDSDSPTQQFAETIADQGGRLEQVLSDLEHSLVSLFTAQIDALGRLAEQARDQERRWVEQTANRRAAL